MKELTRGCPRQGDPRTWLVFETCFLTSKNSIGSCNQHAVNGFPGARKCVTGWGTRMNREVRQSLSHRKTERQEFLPWLRGNELPRIHEIVQSLASLSGLGIRHCCRRGVGQRYGSDPALLWLWRRPAAAVRIQPLAWELPYAASAALKTK